MMLIKTNVTHKQSQSHVVKTENCLRSASTKCVTYANLFFTFIFSTRHTSIFYAPLFAIEFYANIAGSPSQASPGAASMLREKKNCSINLSTITTSAAKNKKNDQLCQQRWQKRIIWIHKVFESTCSSHTPRFNLAKCNLPRIRVHNMSCKFELSLLMSKHFSIYSF